MFIEVAHPDARLELPDHPAATVQWLDLPDGAPPGDALVAAVTGADLPQGTRVWGAGEAAAVQRIRRHLLEERNLPRSEPESAATGNTVAPEVPRPTRRSLRPHHLALGGRREPLGLLAGGAVERRLVAHAAQIAW